MVFWLAMLGVMTTRMVVTNVWWWCRQKAGPPKTIRDFPKPGDVRTHYAEWKGDNFDRLLSRYVHYARSANSIDETRKDLDRVAWGGVQTGVPDKLDGIDRLMQWWFAGNHADVGGG